MLDPHTALILAGYGHSVSQTKLAGAAKGYYCNLLGRTLVQEQAARNRRLKTRASVSEQEHGLSVQKETIDAVSRFARMCYRRNLSERGDRIDDSAEQLVWEILQATGAEIPQ